MSRKPYECYICQRNGFNEIMVYLAGKDENNKTIYLEEDGTKHIHKTKGQQPTAKQGYERYQDSESDKMSDYQIPVTEPATTAMKIINAKLDRIITLLTESHQQQQKQQ